MRQLLVFRERNLNRILAVACAGVLLFFAPARGQDDRLVTTPPLEQVLPLEAKSGDVKLKFPVLLDSRTILGPDVVLHSIYIDPNAGMRAHGGHASGGGGDSSGDGMGGGRHHHGASGGDDSGDGPMGGLAPDSASDSLSGGNKSSAKGLSNETWHDVDTFQQALHGANDLGTMIVYARPGEKPRSAMIQLPDGMLLGELGGHVQVLALSADSPTAAAGLQPGDRFESIGGKPVASLRDFILIYSATAEQARKENKPYSLQVARAGEAAPVTIQVGAPPSLMHMM